MASDLSSVCTETNELFDDEKEEGEISLEDVSSSEEGPPFRYQPRAFGQCPHCRSTGHCHTWCKNMTLNTKIFVRASQRKPLGKVQPYMRAEVAYVVTEDAGKENRRHHHHHHHHHTHHQRPPPAGLFNEDLQPISSDSDLELVGLAKKKKTRKKKRRKRSPSFSLSPETVDQAIKESIHREPPRKHESPVRRKPQQQQPHKSLPPRKLSPQRMKKLKKPISGDSQLQSRGTVSKLLKKVKKLEPFSSRKKEKRSSLKDKLSNIIGGKKSDEEEAVLIVEKTKEKSPEVERREVTKKPDVPKVEEQKEVIIIEEEKKKEVAVEEKIKADDEDLAVLKKIAPEAIVSSEPAEEPKPTAPVPAKEEQRPQEPDEDLQLRVIALRSAVMKKHRTRIARKKKQEQLQQQEQQSSSSEPVPRIENPFTSSFNLDFPLLAEICSPSSPLDPKKNDIYCPEDMELDSDMEVDKEIAMVFSGAEDETNNIVDGDSPYSPTDDLGSPQQVIDQPMDLSMYTPLKPTETPMVVPDIIKNDTLDGSICESRPYSPSDATVYDPELPGVMATNSNVLPPLQRPPLPPLGIMPMMPLNPMNLLGTYPIMPISGFAPVNPMLTTPFIPFTPTTTAPNNVTTQLMEEFGETDLDGSPLVPIEPKDANWKFIGEPLYLPEINQLTMPSLVPAPVLKCNKHLQKSPPIKKPSESLFRNAEMRPVAIEEENKVSAATFKPIKLPVPVKKSVTTQAAAAFDAPADETIDSQKQIWPELEQDLRELEELEEQENKRRQELEEKKKQEQRETEERKKQEQREAEERRKQEQREAEELEKRRKQEHRESEERRKKEEAERRKKREREEADRRRRQTLRRLRQKSVTPAPRTRRRNARTPSRSREIYRHKSSRSSRDKESRSQSKRTESSKEKSNEKARKVSIDDDEQALREILLASLAKRKPNAKRKAALEAAKRKAALEAAKTTSDKENIAEKPVEPVTATATAAAAAAAATTAAAATAAAASAPEVDKLKETATLKKPAMLEMPQNIPSSDIETNVPFSLANLPSVLKPAVLQQATLKRPAPALLPSEQPLRKVVKKINVIPASTRAVNNAKRYQNLLLQRKLLTQQKLALYRTRFSLNNDQRPKSPQVVLSPNQSPRFVISLNEDTETDSELDEKKKESPAKSRPVLAIPTSDFEKNLDMFLKNVRLQQEQLTTTTPATISKAVTPPLVVQTTNTVRSKTLTGTTTIPAVTVATTVAVPTTAAPAIAKVAVTTSAAIAVPKIVTTTAAASTLKERTVLNIPKPTTTASLLSNISTTPQAVKHLPVSQQEEYRRLKQQIYEYEQLRLQKAKESTTSQAQSTTVKPVNTSSSPITPLSSPTVLTTSTPKAPRAKHMPKTQLIATISPMSKPSTTLTPVIVTPTKIIHSTTNVTTKTVAPTINPVSKVTSSSIVLSSSSKPVVTSAAKVTQPDPKQLQLLSKITQSLNSQKTLLNSAASKISSLRVLTMEQINQKTSQIQQKNNCVAMDDLNKTGENVVANKKSSSKQIIEAEKTSERKQPGNNVEEDVAAKKSSKEAPPAVEKSKDEDNSKQTWEDFRQVVHDEVQTLSNLSTEKQKELLAEAEGKLISKRHAVLNDITQMSGSLRQWEIERDLQNNITAEIISLREQLRIAEEKLQGQKVKLQKIQPKVTLYQKKINTGRKECFRLSKICNGLGQKIVGSDYIVPTAGAELLNNRIKEVATHTQKLCGKKTVSPLVQNNNSAKTGRLLKSSPKVNVNPNLGVKEFKRKKKYIVDTETDKSDSISESAQALLKEKISEKGAGAVVSNVNKPLNVENIFNTQSSNQPMDIDNEKLNTNTNVVANSKESAEKSQSTNLNIKQDRIIDNEQLAKSKTVSEKVRESNSDVTSSVTVNNEATLSMEIDNQCDSNNKNIMSNNGVGINEFESRIENTNNNAATSNVEAIEESYSVTNTVSDNSEASSMEIVEEAECTSKNKISNNNTETLNVGTSNEFEIVNNNVETPSIVIVAGSNVNETINNTELPTEEAVEKSECNAMNNVVTDTAISNKKEVDSETSNNGKIDKSGYNTRSQIIENNTEVLDPEKVVNAVAENETSFNNEKLPEVQAKQTENSIETDSQKQLEETDAIVQSNVSTESEKNADESCTSNSILNNAFEDAPDKMENDNVDTNINDETRTDKQSTNSGPTIVITENVESDSVNNNTSSVVNTSLDDYMTEMTISDKYDNMCSKDYKSSASVTSTEHSTTFEEEIRLLELASEGDAPHEFTNDSQSDSKAEHETIDNFQSIAKVQHGSIDECQSIEKAEHETIDNCQSIAKTEEKPANDCKSIAAVKHESTVKIEQHATDNPSTQSLPKKSSKKAFRPYESILKLLHVPRNEEYNGILCPFALMGTCIDEDCRYIHQSTSHCQ